MFEKELKRVRPGDEFTQAVVLEATGMRVWVGTGEHNAIVLNDRAGRLYKMPVPRSWAVRATGEATGAVADLESGLWDLVRQMGLSPLEIVFFRSLDPNVIVRVEMEGMQGGGRLEVPMVCDWAVRFASVVQVPLLLEADLAEDWLVKDAQGQPLAGDAAWKRATREPKIYDNLDQLLEELETELRTGTADGPARRAFEQAHPEGNHAEPLIRDRGGGLERIEQWARSQPDLEIQGRAWGLLGAVVLREPDPVRIREALPYLQKAHELVPQAADVGFDLATAHALLGRTEEAWGLLEQFRSPNAARCGNFRSLWSQERFVRLFGPGRGEFAEAYWSEQLHSTRGYQASESARNKPDPDRWEFLVDLARLDPAWIADRGALKDHVPVRRLRAPVGTEEHVLLVLDNGGCIAWPMPSWSDRRHTDLVCALSESEQPWYEPCQSATVAMGQLGIRPRAVQLEPADRIPAAQFHALHSHGDLVVRLDALDGVNLAYRNSVPILVHPRLIRDLAVKGQAGQPLSAGQALERLRQEG